MTADMRNRTVLVTGANSGIGLVTAKQLASAGAEVILVCRDPQRGEQAKLAVTPLAAVAPSLMIADMSSQESIRNLVKQLSAKSNRLDVLVNNAGAVFGNRQLTEDGLERTFATNHLGPFLLTLLLMPHLRRSSAGRVVNVSSRIHADGLDLDDLQSKRNYSPMRVYGESKLQNILFTYELARRLGDGTVTANCLAPGLVSTNFGRKAGGIFGLLSRFMALAPGSVTPEVGAETSIYLASADAVSGVTGKYFYRCAETPSKSISYDITIAKRLWDHSRELVGEDL